MRKVHREVLKAVREELPDGWRVELVHKRGGGHSYIDLFDPSGERRAETQVRTTPRSLADHVKNMRRWALKESRK